MKTEKEKEEDEKLMKKAKRDSLSGKSIFHWRPLQFHFSELL